MKGVALGIAPTLTLVDIAHDIPAQGIVHGGLVLANAVPFFPPGTVHVCVIDPGVGTARNPVVVQCGGQVFVAPDNGLLSQVLGELGQVPVAHRIMSHDWLLQNQSTTFHGRDIFLPTGAAIAAGLLSPLEVGPRLLWPTVEDAVDIPDGWDGAVVAIDRFGNCITNLADSVLVGAESRDAWRIEVCGGPVLEVRLTYADVKSGEPVALVGSAGWIEIAVRDGSASEYFAVEPGTPVRLIRPA
jgi:hypothetical protein